ncbi:MAG: hypothetical protein ACOYJ1_04115 [Peptococcales bacterium]|jgi:hypothetical protein
MNNNEIKEAISIFYKEIMDKLVQDYATDYEGLIEKWLEFHEFYLENANAFLEQRAQGPVMQISANQVVIEVTDKDTGKTFRRTLPLEYFETDNGIKLSGDTLDGTPSHLAFLSETALLRMKDILGKGPDTHRCED